MSQIALPFESSFQSSSEIPFDAAAANTTAFDAAGFEIGWDHAHHRLTPPADHLHGTHPVRQGWEAGRAAFGARTLKPSRQVRQWLELRLQAWLRGQAFEDVRVTPRFLAQIDVLQCPVTREVLTHGMDLPTDAVVVRVFDGAGYAAGNLAVLSRRAAQALGSCSAAEAEAIARRITAGEVDQVGGLGATQWQRLASLLRLATPMPHTQLACLPLRVLPPNRLSVLNPVQALQALLTVLFTGEAYARRMTNVGALMPSTDARRQFFLFMNAMLARRLAVGWAADRQRVRTTLEDAWAHPVIQRRWEQLALRLTRADCERIVKLATQRGFVGSACHWVEDDSATEGWAIESQGRVPAATAAAAVSTQGPATLADAAVLRRARRVLPPAMPAGVTRVERV